MIIKNKNFILRCMVDKKNGLWMACCLDLNICAYHADRQKAMDKLEMMVKAHIEANTTYSYFNFDKLPIHTFLTYTKCPKRWWITYFLKKYILGEWFDLFDLDYLIPKDLGIDNLDDLYR